MTPKLDRETVEACAQVLQKIRAASEDHGDGCVWRLDEALKAIRALLPTGAVTQGSPASGTQTDASLQDMSSECDSVRREMRLKILRLDDGELQNLYYRAITLSEHEAARRALAQRDRRLDKYGLALMMIREGCADPAKFAAKILASPSASGTGDEAAPVAWLHEVDEPDLGHHQMFSQSPNNPWDHWKNSYKDQCKFKATPLYSAAPPLREQGIAGE